MADYFQHVPKALGANLAYRLKLRKRAAAEPAFRRAMLKACKDDVLFWLAAFCFVYEPRVRFDSKGKQLPKSLPFIPWEHQVPAIKQIKEKLGIEDIGVEKSRGEGMSWIALMLALHDWLFDPGSKVGIISNTEKKSDDAGNLDSLGGKLDWAIARLPKWMVPPFKRNIADHSWVNEANGSQINAFAATSDAGRGGRYKWFLCDELAFWDRGPDAKFMASSSGATESRLVISTPNGTDGEYFAFMHAPSGRVHVVLDWKDNPTRNRGLYRLIKGRPEAVDPINNPLPPDYQALSHALLDKFSQLRRKGFQIEKGLRSPWYDVQCLRSDSTPQSIAREYDRDYGGAMYKYFGHDFTEKVNNWVKQPTLRGNLGYHPETLAPDFDSADDGQLHLWCPLDIKKRPPKHPYVIGSDVGTGLGGSYTSNSVAFVLDMLTSEQVGEFATNTMPPGDFADWCIALCHWFHDALLIWEHNGPGAYFTNRVRSRAYAKTYKRKQQFKNSVKNTSDLGWWTTRDTKELMFGAFYQGVKGEEFTVHSELLAKECGEYVRANGKIVHVSQGNTEDESSKGEAHGDRVIAACVALQGGKDRPMMAKQAAQESRENPPYGTLAWREKHHDDLLREDNDPWDQRTNDDLAAGGRFRSSVGF